MINKLKERLKELEMQKQRAQSILNRAVADVNAIGGAIQEVSRLISELEKAEAESSNDKSKDKSDNDK